MAKPSLYSEIDFWAGVARGQLETDGKYYSGPLFISDGPTIWVGLDRYTGEIVLAPPSQRENEPILFAGDCKEAKAKF